jgi:hypothetical protein
MFSPRSAILTAAGHSVDRTVTGLTTTRTKDAGNG